MRPDRRQPDRILGRVTITPVGGDKPGIEARFPYDRALVERLMKAFPRARWREAEGAWFIPGTTAERRLTRWLAQELPPGGDYGDAKGRDAFDFDPIESPYLEVADDLRVRTPYSRTVVDQMHAIPWSWWDGATRTWRVPFRSYEELWRRWPVIEAAARRNEPEERRKRRLAEWTPERQRRAAILAAERRRHRYPVLAANLPPLAQPVMTERFGVLAFTEITGEIANPAGIAEIYAHPDLAAGDYVWASWRRPSLDELIGVWPSRAEAGPDERVRGWWRPTREELRQARRDARVRERLRERRRAGAEAAS
ncbi:hypothetical protein KXR53_08335 [Inquilinus limosus]|uniref:hypothetical protein n=1 Tax=Inquilinus limosus TaxID=171674 RepID=UPI003F139AFC